MPAFPQTTNVAFTLATNVAFTLDHHGPCRPRSLKTLMAVDLKDEPNAGEHQCIPFTRTALPLVTHTTLSSHNFCLSMLVSTHFNTLLPATHHSKPAPARSTHVFPSSLLLCSSLISTFPPFLPSFLCETLAPAHRNPSK